MYTIAETDDCTCFKCQNAKANKTFGVKIKELTKHMGFVPKQYDISCGFNKLPPQYGTGDQIPTNVLNNITHNLEVVLEKNKHLQFEKKKHPVISDYRNGFCRKT